MSNSIVKCRTCRRSVPPVWDVLESSNQSLLGSKIDDAAESVTNVPLWLAQLDGKGPG
jgi:hypothetical protein